MHHPDIIGRDIEFLIWTEGSEYAEEGIRARVLSVTDQHDDCWKIEIDYEHWAAHNRSFETGGFYYKDGSGRTGTARETGWYEPQDSLYVPGPESWFETFKLLDQNAAALIEEWRESGTGKSYAGWLEEIVLSYRKAAA